MVRRSSKEGGEVPVAVGPHEGDVSLDHLRGGVRNLEWHHFVSLRLQSLHCLQNSSLASRDRLEVSIAGHVRNLQMSARASLSILSTPRKVRDRWILFALRSSENKRESRARDSQDKRREKSCHHSVTVPHTGGQ
jgi:hypothetical protein